MTTNGGAESARASILVVDDNEVNAKLLGATLELEGYEVRVARDADQALEILGGFRPGLIFMDVQLPGMDGLELTRRLKADPDWAMTPVIAVTAYAREEDRQQALEAGCDGYLPKPIDTRTLAEVVARSLGAGGAGR